MKPILLSFGLAVALTAGPLEIRQSGFRAGASGVPSGWQTWAARPEIAPRTFVDTTHYRRQPGSLAISGNRNPAAYGGWEYIVSAIEPGKWYRFTAYYRAEGVDNERLQVVSRLDWLRNRPALALAAGDYASPYLDSVRIGIDNRETCLDILPHSRPSSFTPAV